MKIIMIYIVRSRVFVSQGEGEDNGEDDDDDDDDVVD